ncbi:MAG: hypothetical protein JW834_01960 [Candidatus Diapherotrites archaeon]|nr:hypothetical protein [Candidatus Diapherotrites archaeon]
MKKIVLLILVIAAAMAAEPHAVTASEVQYFDQIEVPYRPTTYPSSLQFGDKGVKVEMSLINRHTESLHNLSTQLLVTGPFKGVKTTDSITRIDPSERATVFYTFDIDDDAEPGEYLITHVIDMVDYDGNKLRAIRTVAFSVSHTQRLEVKEIDMPEMLPGQTADCRVTFENTGDLLADDVRVVLTPSNASSIEIVPSEKRLGDILPGETADAEFRVKAAKYASAKDYTISLVAYYGNNSLSQTFLATIAGSPALDVTSIEFPPTVLPGELVPLRISLTNKGGAVLMAIASTLSSATEGIAVVSDSSVFVDRLNPEESVEADYNVKLDKSVEVGVYSLTLSMNSEDVSQQQTISFEVRGVPKLQLAGVQSDKELIYAGTPFSLSVQLENIGTGNAKSVKATLKDGTAEGITTTYIGTIEIDDTGTALFDIKDNVAGKKVATALITFEDEYGKEFTNSVEVQYVIEAMPFNPLPIILVLALGGAAAYLYYRKKKREEQIKKLVK